MCLPLDNTDGCVILFGGFSNKKILRYNSSPSICDSKMAAKDDSSFKFPWFTGNYFEIKARPDGWVCAFAAGIGAAQIIIWKEIPDVLYVPPCIMANCQPWSPIRGSLLRSLTTTQVTYVLDETQCFWSWQKLIYSKWNPMLVKKKKKLKMVSASVRYISTINIWEADSKRIAYSFSTQSS